MQHMYVIGSTGVFQWQNILYFKILGADLYHCLLCTTMLCSGLLGGGLKNNFSKGNYKGKADCSFPVWKTSREILESWEIHWVCFSGCVSALHLV